MIGDGQTDMNNDKNQPKQNNDMKIDGDESKETEIMCAEPPFRESSDIKNSTHANATGEKRNEEALECQYAQAGELDHEIARGTEYICAETPFRNTER